MGSTLARWEDLAALVAAGSVPRLFDRVAQETAAAFRLWKRTNLGSTKAKDVSKIYTTVGTTRLLLGYFEGKTKPEMTDKAPTTPSTVSIAKEDDIDIRKHNSDAGSGAGWPGQLPRVVRNKFFPGCNQMV